MIGIKLNKYEYFRATSSGWTITLFNLSVSG